MGTTNVGNLETVNLYLFIRAFYDRSKIFAVHGKMLLLIVTFALSLVVSVGVPLSYPFLNFYKKQIGRG